MDMIDQTAATGSPFLGDAERMISVAGTTNHIAPDCQGMNFYRIDPSFQASLRANMDPATFRHFEPWLHVLGETAGGRLDVLARLVERNPPVLEHRDRFGTGSLDAIAYHPAYREMEKDRLRGVPAARDVPSSPGAFRAATAPAPQVAKYVIPVPVLRSPSSG